MSRTESLTITSNVVVRALLAMLLVVVPAQALLAQGFSSVSGTTEAVANIATPPSAVGDIAAVSPMLPRDEASSSRGGRSNGSFELADKVLVRKGERRLYLLREDRVIAEYPVRLGLNPFGPKTREGDFRTPEGKYQLVKRNAQSEFFLSIQVSYPSAEDAAVAKENGVAPGGLIMIHGQPNVPRRPLEFYATRDWTDGCIALSNADMVDVWLRTGIGIPIEIRP